jgi:hypothetical protein
MLRDNVYALKRCEAKYKARFRATRTRPDFAVLRRDTVELMRSAARRLAGVRETKAVYTEADIPGLGKNVLTERDRVRGLEAYRFYARYFALLALKDAVLAGAAAGWEYARGILAEDGGPADAAAGLRELADMALQVAKDTERVRAKDDARGVKVIDDYADVHPAADRDRVVRQAWAEADRIRAEVEQCLGRLDHPGAGSSATRPAGSASDRPGIHVP